MAIKYTNPPLDKLMRDLYNSRERFLKDGNLDCVKLIDCIRDKIMNDYFKGEIKVYDSKGRLRILVDNSFNFQESETVEPTKDTQKKRRIVRFSDTWDGLEKHAPLIWYIKKRIPVRAIWMREDFEIQTLEGLQTGAKGDYVIEGVEGEVYCCKGEIFEKTYVALAAEGEDE